MSCKQDWFHLFCNQQSCWEETGLANCLSYLQCFWPLFGKLEEILAERKIKWHLMFVKSYIQVGRFFRGLVWCLLGFRGAWAWLTDHVAMCLVLRNNQASKGTHHGTGQFQWQWPPLGQGYDRYQTSSWEGIEHSPKRHGFLESCQITYRTPH